MTISSKRAEYLSRASLVWSVFCYVLTLLLGLWSGFFGVIAISWLVLGSVAIWLVLCLHFHQRSLAEQERLDASELAKDKEGSTIFRSSGDRGVLFDAAGRRLVTFEKWFLPIFSTLIAVYQLSIGIYLVRKVSVGVDYGSQQPLVVAVGLAAIAFVSFLLARYAIGMSAQQQWKPLRAGGSFLLGIAVLCFGLAIALALVQFQYPIFKDIINWVIPILMVILGIECLLNVVFDIYRPRLKEQYQKSALDSRLLGLISEPGGIFRTAASAIDYQFGFKVSQTWFYKLLMEKAIVPLVLFSVAILYFLSCIVTVGPEEEAIIEHFGSPFTASGEKRIVGPGLTWKWPWPIDIAYKYPTQKISQINIGFEEEEEESHGQGHGPLLWGKSHYHEEYSLLVASESSDSSQDDESVPVSMVIAAVPVQYRIKDLYAFLYNYGQVEEISGRHRRKVYQSEKLLESICYRELTMLAASAKIEGNTEADFELCLLGAGRSKAKELLTERIQQKADEAKLGVEIVFVGLQGIHPPADVAASYQEVIGAEQTKQAAILAAEADRIGRLSMLAGSVDQAKKLYDLTAEYQLARKSGDGAQLERVSVKLDSAFAGVNGGLYSLLRVARAYAFEKVTLAKAKSERFVGQLEAYQAAPNYYVNQKRLEVFESESLQDIRKYVLVVDPNEMQYVIDFKDKLPTDLYDFTGMKKKGK